MSLINDALKRAHESQEKSAGSPPPLTPIANQSSGGLGWVLPVAIVLFLVAGGLLVWVAVTHKSSTLAVPVVSHPAPVITAVETAPSSPPPQAPPSPPAPAVAPPPNATAPTPVAQTNVLVGLLPERLPKVQGIIFSATPIAIVNGKMLNVGDRLGHYVVKQITRSVVIFQRDDGSVKQLGVGQ